jgi:hypothetical protein
MVDTTVRIVTILESPLKISFSLTTYIKLDAEEIKLT